MKFSSTYDNGAAPPWTVNLNENTTVAVETSSVKFLGVCLDPHLDWKEHIRQLTSRMAQFSYALKVISSSVSPEAAMTAYHAYVGSRVRYGIIFWGGSTRVVEVLRAQKRCLRGIFGLKQTDSCIPIFQRYGILTVTSLYILECAMFVRRNLGFFEEFQRRHGHCTRGKSDLCPRKPRLTMEMRNVTHSAIKIYNGVPEKVRVLPLEALRSRLRRYLAEKSFYTLDDFFNDEDGCL